MLDMQANVVSPHALGDGLHLVALSLGGQPHRGHQLLLLPLDLLVLDLNLLPSLYNLHKLRIVKLREREGQGVDPGRSLKGHLWMVDGGWWISFP